MAENRRPLGLLIMCLLMVVAGRVSASSFDFNRDNRSPQPLPAQELLLYNIPGGVELQQVKTGFAQLAQAWGILSTNRAGIKNGPAVSLLYTAEEAFQKGREAPLTFCAATLGLAKVYELRGEIDSVRALLASGVQKHPTNSLLLLAQGEVLRKGGRLQDAEAAYCAAMKNPPLLPAVYEGLADVQIETLRYDDAINSCRKGIALWPDQEWLADTLVKALSLAGEKEAAMKNCQSFLSTHPAWVRLRYRYGQLLLRCGRTDEGVAVMREVIRLDPKCCDAYNELGLVPLNKDQYQSALVYFRSGLMVHPDCSTLLGNMGLCYREMGDLDKSIEVLKQTLRIDPAMEPAIINLAGAYRKKGDFTNALAVCTHGIQLRPWSASLFFATSDCLCQMERNKEALHYARTGMGLGKPSAFDWARYAYLLVECSYPEEAVKAYETAATLDTHEVKYVTGRAWALKAGGRVEEAITACEAAMRRFPNRVLAWETMAAILHEEGRVNDAISWFKKGTEVKGAPPEDQSIVGNCWGKMGWLYFLQRRWKEAQEAFSRAHQADPANPQWRSKMLEAETQLAPENSKKKLSEALKQHPGDAELACLHANLICQSGTEQERADALRGLEAWKEATPHILFWRGALANVLGQSEKAESCWREVVRLMPQWAAPYDELGKAARKRKAPFAEMKALYQKAIELEPSNAIYHNNLGYAYLMDGQHNNALRELDRAIALDPSCGLAYYNLGLARYAAGDYKESWSAISKARELGYMGDPGFVMKLETRLRVMGLNTTNAPAYGPVRQPSVSGDGSNIIMRIRTQTERIK